MPLFIVSVCMLIFAIVVRIIEDKKEEQRELDEFNEMLDSFSEVSSHYAVIMPVECEWTCSQPKRNGKYKKYK